MNVKTRSIKSLKEINVEMYEEYLEREIKMLFSNNKFENSTFEIKYKEIIQRQLNKIDKNGDIKFETFLISFQNLYVHAY